MFKFVGEISCLSVYDGNRAKLGGVVRNSNDPTIPVRCSNHVTAVPESSVWRESAKCDVGEIVARSCSSCSHRRVPCSGFL